MHYPQSRELRQLIEEAKIESAQLTCSDSPNNGSLEWQTCGVSEMKKMVERKAHSRNVARSMVSVFSTSLKEPTSPISLMKTSPWDVERCDRGGSARSKALIRYSGR